MQPLPNGTVVRLKPDRVWGGIKPGEQHTHGPLTGRSGALCWSARLHTQNDPITSMHKPTNGGADLNVPSASCHASRKVGLVLPYCPMASRRVSASTAIKENTKNDRWRLAMVSFATSSSVPRIQRWENL